MPIVKLSNPITDTIKKAGLYLAGMLFVLMSIHLVAVKWELSRLTKQYDKDKITYALKDASIQSKDLALGGLQRALINCANQRAEAAQRAETAENALAIRKGLMQVKTQERIDEVLKNAKIKPASKSSEGNDCPIASLRPRTVELLVEAADSANRAGSGH